MVTIELGSDCQNKNYTIDFFVAVTNYDILKDLDIYQNSTKEYLGRFTDFLPIEPYDPLSFSMLESISWLNPFSFHYENFNPGDDGYAFIRIKELDIQNCMFSHNVIDVGGLSVSSFVFTMINNGTDLCKSTIFNIWPKYPYDSHRFQDFWTTSKENVVSLDPNGKKVLEFNQRNASEIPRLNLNDIFYEVFLPSNSSVTFQGFYD
uniref:Uncharacterized protein n=1 Tax=Panagrolaimus sp. JU765 TaxID=591449 RepID=A0AC34R9Y9_9BILA